MNRRSLLALAPVTLFALACDKFLNIVAKAGNIAELVRKAITLFRSALPSLGLSADTEAQVAEVMAATEKALEAFEASAKLTGATAAGKQAEARAELLKAYEALYQLMERVGVLGALGEVATGPGEGERPITPDELRAETALFFGEAG